MPHIYDNFLEIADKFDILLVDAYGVFWNGKDFYAGSREVLAQQVQQGKRVIIVSNTTALSDAAVNSYTKKGLIQGKHYTDFITSGDVAHSAFINDNIAANGHNIYMFGTPNLKIFENTPFNIVSSIADANAFYISVPQLSENKVSELELYEK